MGNHGAVICRDCGNRYTTQADLAAHPCEETPALTQPVINFLLGEIGNERDGGESPSTLATAADSLAQGGPDVFGLTVDDVACFHRLLLTNVASSTSLIELLSGDDYNVAQPAEPLMQVWVLAIEHRHGEELTVHQTRETADEALDRWVTEWWDDEVPGRVMPTDRDERITEYFDRADGEYYGMQLVPVTPEKTHIIPEAVEIGDLT
jgi:hypothetical protein